MTVKDGFKFGIGFTLGTSTVKIVCDMLDKKSSLRKQWDRCVAAVKADKKPEKPVVYPTATFRKDI